jgi:hypothetical protein
MVRLFSIVAMTALLAGMAGCGGPPREEREIWQGVRIPDLAPPPGEKRPEARFLATVHMDIHVLDLPAENVDQLDDLWNLLSPRFIYMSSYNAFKDNCFRLKFGRIEMWDTIQKILADANGQKVATITLAIPDNDSSDLTVADMPASRTISFIGSNLSSQTVNVGPGKLVLRLRAEPILGARGVRKIIAYPTHTLPATSAIPQLNLMARRSEFYFASAAFAAQMGPGDLLVLGPDSYAGERMTLGGLFFDNPRGRVFFNPAKARPPEQKPAVRIYILICTAITEGT